MYLRFSQRTNADGTVVRYVALAHNRRVDGKVKPDVLMNLGRVDRLDVDGLLRLAASIRKHFGDGGGLTDSAEAGEVTGAAPMEVSSTPGRSAPPGCWTRCGPGWRSVPRSSGSPMAGGSPRRWSGCCSRWSPTAPSSR
jgi:hypothetical protein